MSTVITQKTAFVIRYKDDGKLLVEGPDEDRFLITIRRAVQSLQISEQIEEFRVQFNLLVKILGNWMKDHDDLDEAYITLRDGSLAFVVIRKVAEYCKDFEDSLSDLDIQIAKDEELRLIRLTSIALPPIGEEALDTFLNSDFRIAINAERNRSHSTSEQK